MNITHIARHLSTSDTIEVTEVTAEWSIVADAMTRWWLRHADVSQVLAERILATPADGITEGDDAYMILCDSVPGYRDGDVPAEVLTAGRDALRLDDEDGVSHGF